MEFVFQQVVICKLESLFPIKTVLIHNAVEDQVNFLMKQLVISKLIKKMELFHQLWIWKTQETTLLIVRAINIVKRILIEKQYVLRHSVQDCWQVTLWQQHLVHLIMWLNLLLQQVNLILFQMNRKLIKQQRMIDLKKDWNWIKTECMLGATIDKWNHLVLIGNNNQSNLPLVLNIIIICKHSL